MARECSKILMILFENFGFYFLYENSTNLRQVSGRLKDLFPPKRG